MSWTEIPATYRHTCEAARCQAQQCERREVVTDSTELPNYWAHVEVENGDGETGPMAICDECASYLFRHLRAPSEVNKPPPPDCYLVTANDGVTPMCSRCERKGAMIAGCQRAECVVRAAYVDEP